MPPSKSVMFASFLSVLLRQWPSALLILGAAAYLVSNHFSHGFNRYPGPFLASLTDLWRFCIVYGRRPEVTHIKLHRKHGDVVRLGPSVLSFANPAAIKEIYGLKKGFKKVNDNISPGYEARAHTLINSRHSIPCKWQYPRARNCPHCSQRQMRRFMLIFAGLSMAPSQ